MAATLVPLRIFNKNAQLMKEISETVVKKVERVFIEIDQLEERLANCLDNIAVDKFPLLENTIRDVREAVEMFHLNFKRKIRYALPQIRSGSQNEDLLVKILDWRKQSPCNSSSLVAWIRDKECDIGVIDSLLTGRDVFDDLGLNQVLLDNQVDYIVALVVKRYSQRDPYTKIIDDFNTNDAWEPGSHMELFPMMDKIQDIRKISERFSRFAENNKNIGITKIAVKEESLAEGDEAKWEIFLRLFRKGETTEAKFLPPPGLDKIQVKHKPPLY